jgi:hypothetical protein
MPTDGADPKVGFFVIGKKTEPKGDLIRNVISELGRWKYVRIYTSCVVLANAAQARKLERQTPNVPWQMSYGIKAGPKVIT